MLFGSVLENAVLLSSYYIPKNGNINIVRTKEKWEKSILVKLAIKTLLFKIKQKAIMHKNIHSQQLKGFHIQNNPV